MTNWNRFARSALGRPSRSQAGVGLLLAGLLAVPSLASAQAPAGGTASPTTTTPTPPPAATTPPTAPAATPAPPAAAPATSAAIQGLSPAELLREVDRRLQPGSFEAYRKLINIEPNGRTKEFVLYTAKKGIDRVVGLFLSPASDKGRATLRQGDNMWLYIPNVGKPLRITSLQSVTGGVFNNSDILQVDYTAEYDVAKVEQQADAIRLSLKAKTASIAYDRLEMRVDPASLQPRTIECYASSGMLIKTLHFKEPKDLGGGFVRPSVIETDSPLQKGYRSVMVYASLRAREFPDEVFTLNYLSRVQELR